MCAVAEVAGGTGSVETARARVQEHLSELHRRRDELGLDPEQQRLLERYHRDFVRAGAQLSEADKTRMRALNEEESKLSTEFHNRLLAATKAGAVVVDDVPARAVVMGVPARVVRDVPDADLVERWR
jgi:Zn-dependent oligopeptidase